MDRWLTRLTRDYVKSIWALGLIEIFIYTVTGALVYAFVGSKVDSPALLSTSTLVSRIAFGIALPVIFISGSINSTVSPVLQTTGHAFNVYGSGLARCQNLADCTF